MARFFTRICSTAGTIIIIIQKKKRFDLDKAKTLLVYPPLGDVALVAMATLTLYCVAEACFIHVCNLLWLVFGTYFMFISLAVPIDVGTPKRREARKCGGIRI